MPQRLVILQKARKGEVVASHKYHARKLKPDGTWQYMYDEPRLPHMSAPKQPKQTGPSLFDYAGIDMDAKEPAPVAEQQASLLDMDSVDKPKPSAPLAAMPAYRMPDGLTPAEQQIMQALADGHIVANGTHKPGEIYDKDDYITSHGPVDENAARSLEQKGLIERWGLFWVPAGESSHEPERSTDQPAPPAPRPQPAPAEQPAEEPTALPASAVVPYVKPAEKRGYGYWQDGDRGSATVPHPRWSDDDRINMFLGVTRDGDTLHVHHDEQLLEPEWSFSIPFAAKGRGQAALNAVMAASPKLRDKPEVAMHYADAIDEAARKIVDEPKKEAAKAAREADKQAKADAAAAAKEARNTAPKTEMDSHGEQFSHHDLDDILTLYNKVREVGPDKPVDPGDYTPTAVSYATDHGFIFDEFQRTAYTNGFNSKFGLEDAVLRHPKDKRLDGVSGDVKRAIRRQRGTIPPMLFTSWPGDPAAHLPAPALWKIVGPMLDQGSRDRVIGNQLLRDPGWNKLGAFPNGHPDYSDGSYKRQIEVINKLARAGYLHVNNAGGILEVRDDWMRRKLERGE